MGVGIVILNGNTKTNISKYLDDNGTNNKAEIIAVIEALKHLDTTKLYRYNIELYTDSQLVVGYLNNTYAINKNTKLVTEMIQLKNLCNKFNAIKIKGHADDKYNIEADKLARTSITKYKNIGEYKNVTQI